jgi:hypothetical protein
MMDEKIDKIVELDIDDEQLEEEIFEGTGVDIVSIVDRPAIQADFLYFHEEEFVEPMIGENHDDYMERCIGVEIGEGKPQDQAVAICHSKWEAVHGSTEMAKHGCKKDKDGKCKKGYEAILEYAEDNNNGYYIGRDDLYIDMTLNTFAGIGDVITAIRSLDVLKRLSIKKEEAPETYWKYTGPPAQRDFCRAMLRLADRGKIFTTDEVNKMASLNRDFGPRGNSSYNKLEWKGGPNCTHYWTKLEVFKGDTGNKVIIASNRADNVKEEKAMKSNNQRQPSPQGSTPNNAFIKKRNFSFNIDDEKRIVMGPVMIPNKMILRRDEDGNPFYIYFSKKTIRKMAEKFFRTNKHNNTDINHDENITNDNTLIESWISESIRHDKSYKYGFALPEGTWYVSYKINDDETWERIKQGELKGFSLAGGFIQKMKPVDPDKTLDEIKDILKKVKQ